ncbi:MAG: tetraacyldisaccharide 4'-kinase [Planctomycetota bacterium]
MALRAALAAGEAPYGLAVTARNLWYEHRQDAVQRVDVPVVSVGNLTVGGTGKTPMVKWIARHFRQHSKRVAILSRGYGAEAGAKNDEALELEQALTDVPHLQDRDRVASARIAIEELEAEVLLLDDGFQHRRLGRDLDIVLLDATAPFGYEHLLPRGVLREPISGLRRAHAVCLTRATSISAAERDAIRQRVHRIAPEVLWCEATHRPRTLLDKTEQQRPLSELHGQPVAAFCGIGNPAAFRKTLEDAGANVVAWQEFPDHHNYSADDIRDLADKFASCPAATVVCTHKDLVKVQLEQLADRPLQAVVVEIEFLAGEANLAKMLDSVSD